MPAWQVTDAARPEKPGPAARFMVSSRASSNVAIASAPGGSATRKRSSLQCVARAPSGNRAASRCWASSAARSLASLRASRLAQARPVSSHRMTAAKPGARPSASATKVCLGNSPGIALPALCGAKAATKVPAASRAPANAAWAPGPACAQMPATKDDAMSQPCRVTFTGRLAVPNLANSLRIRVSLLRRSHGGGRRLRNVHFIKVNNFKLITMVHGVLS